MVHKFIRGRTAHAIAGSVEQAIHGGRLAPGAGLPTVRRLAGTLGVSPVTVSAAYRLLAARGLVAGAGRLGTRVAPRPPSPAARRSVPADRTASSLVDLATGNPDPALLPPIAAALRSLDPGSRLYGEPADLPALVAFLGQEFESDGIDARAVTVVGGALDGIGRVLEEHLRTGDTVAVEDPCFPALLDLLAADGWRRHPVAVDDAGPMPAAFEDAVRRSRAVIVTPRGQNPYGSALTAERAADLRRILRKHPDVLLIENDPVSAVAGADPRTLSDGGSRRWAVVRSTSKFLGPDLRLAAVAGDELTMARVEGRQALGTRWVSTILQGLALALWSDPANGRLLARASDVYVHRRLALLKALTSHGIDAFGRSGFNVWIPVREEAPLVHALAEKGWAVTAGERFRLHAAPAIRVTASALDPADAARFAADVHDAQAARAVIA